MSFSSWGSVATLDIGVSLYGTSCRNAQRRDLDHRARDRTPTTSSPPTRSGGPDLDTKAVDTARLLAADAVQKAGSGHPGTAMSLAPLAYLLYQRVMRHDPTDPHWVGRDRFVLSNGHSSLTQYCQLFLSGYGLELADLESLRTWGSRTPGHPEHDHTAGRRGHHRPAGPGRRQRRRHGDGRPPRARPVRPGRRRRRVAVRPPHLRDRRRRLHGGGRLQRGVLARRPPAARQPDPVLRRQPHLDRGQHRGRVQRGRPRRATTPTAGTPSASTRARTWSRSRRRSTRPRPTPTGRRSSRCARSSAGRRRPSRTPAPRTARALGDDEIRETKEILGFDPDVNFDVDAEVLAHAREVVDRGREPRTPSGSSRFDAWAARQPERRRAARAAERAARLPDGWTSTRCRPCRPRRTARRTRSRPARRPARC